MFIFQRLWGNSMCMFVWMDVCTSCKIGAVLKERKKNLCYVLIMALNLLH